MKQKNSSHGLCLYCIIAMFFISSSAIAQTEDYKQDSIQLKVYETDSTDDQPFLIGASESQPKIEKKDFRESRLYKATCIGVPIVGLGIFESFFDKKYRDLRNDYMPHFKRSEDNYTQYLPAMVMVGMKTAGVKSRSSWGRMLVSDAFSAAIMATAVNGLKYTVKEQRPDGSARNSFPSGHTATAFMTATMISKEYGYLSPWVSIGAYTTASLTGVMRLANNKHWTSDVLVGAGIGIMSTEFGYWIADAIFKKKGLNMKEYPLEEYYKYDSPVIVGMYMSANIPFSNFDAGNNKSFKTSSGTSIGLEGAYLFNPYFGVGAKASISNMFLISDNNTTIDKTLEFVSIYAGGYFHYPMTEKLYAGTKLLVGQTIYRKMTTPQLNVDDKYGWGVNTGINLGYRLRKHLGTKLFLDYDILPPATKASREYMHMLSIGIGGAIMF